MTDVNNPVQKIFPTPETQEVVDTFTPLEQAFIDAYIPLLYAEAHFSDADVKDVAQAMGQPIATAKGVLGSLCKKRVVNTQDSGTGFDLIYLNEEYFFLHPEWKFDTGW